MKSRKKRPARAITLLTRIEALLGDAMNEFSAMEKTVEKYARALLTSAETSISNAKDLIATAPAPAGGARHRAVRVRPHAARPKAKRAVRGRRPSTVHG